MVMMVISGEVRGGVSFKEDGEEKWEEGGFIMGEYEGNVEMNVGEGSEVVSMGVYLGEVQIKQSGGVIRHLGKIGVGEGATGSIEISGGEFRNEKRDEMGGQIGIGNGGSRVEIEVRGGELVNEGEMGVGQNGAKGTVIVTQSGGGIVNWGKMGEGEGEEGSIEISISGGKYVNEGEMGVGIGGERKDGKGIVTIKQSGGEVINNGEIGVGKSWEGWEERMYAGEGKGKIEISGGRFINAGAIGNAEGGFFSYGSKNSGEVEIEVSGGEYRMVEGGEMGVVYGEGEARVTLKIRGEGRGVHEGGEYGDGVEVEVSEKGVYDMCGQESKEKIIVKGGRLEQARGHRGEVRILSAGEHGGSIKLGGLDGGNIEEIKMGEGERIEGIKKGSQIELKGENEIWVGKSNVREEGSDRDIESVIEFEGGEGSIKLAEDGSLKLGLGAEDILSGINWDEREGGREIRLEVKLSNGDISNTGEEIARGIQLGNGWGLWIEQGEVEGAGVEKGSIIIAGSMEGIWISGEYTGGRENEAPRFDGYRKVVVNRDISLEWDSAEGAESIMRQMEGSGNLQISNKSAGRETLTLIVENADGAGSYGDTTYKGRIELGAGINLEKRGGATWRVAGGGLSAAGKVSVREGILELGKGEGHEIGTLGEVSTGSELKIEGEVEVKGGDSGEGGGKISGGGKIKLSGEWTLGESVRLEGPELEIGTDGKLEVGSNRIIVSSLSGEGSIGMREPGEIEVRGAGRYSGALAGSGKIRIGSGGEQALIGAGNGAYRISIGSGGSARLEGREDGKGAEYGEVRVESGGRLEVAAREKGEEKRAGAGIDVKGDIELSGGSITRLEFNSESGEMRKKGGEALMLSSGGELIIREGARIEVASLIDSEQKKRTSGEGGEMGDIDKVLVMKAQSIRSEQSELELYREGLLYLNYRDVRLEVEGQGVYLSARQREESPLREAAKSENARAGAELLEGAELGSDETLSALGDALGEMLKRGEEGRVGSILAAVAGSSISGMGRAQERQLQGEIERIGGRARQMSERRGSEVELSRSATKARATKLWWAAHSETSREEREGDQSGYRQSVWGGSLGAEYSKGVQRGARQREIGIGIALSAQYGQVKSQSADRATGDISNRYASVYGSYSAEKWEQRIAIVGMQGEMEQERQVEYGSGSYRAQSDVKAQGVGLSYEIERKGLRVGKSELRAYGGIEGESMRREGYRERGAGGAGLEVKSERRQRGSVYVGVGIERELSERVSGKGGYVRAQVAVASEVLRSEKKSEVALQAAPGNRQSVRGVQGGRESVRGGIEMGVGVSRRSRLHVQGYGEWSKNASSLNATLGLHTSF